MASDCGLTNAYRFATALDLEAKTAWPPMLLPWRSRLARKRSFALPATHPIFRQSVPRLPRLKLTCISLMMIFLYPSGLFFQKQRHECDTKFQLTRNFVVRTDYLTLFGTVFSPSPGSIVHQDCLEEADTSWVRPSCLSTDQTDRHCRPRLTPIGAFHHGRNMSRTTLLNQDHLPEPLHSARATGFPTAAHPSIMRSQD